jgi:replicative DNA helicase
MLQHTITPETVKGSPHNVEAEEAVLGSIMVDPAQMKSLRKFLQPDDFFITKNGWLWSAMCKLYDGETEIDYLTVCDALEHAGQLNEFGGYAAVTHLQMTMPSAIHCRSYASDQAQDTRACIVGRVGGI